MTAGESLTITEMKSATRQLFKSETSPIEIGAFLTALKTKGETVDEITGLAQVIGEKSRIEPLRMANVMDNCGTGGDHSQSFNISTTAAFVIAGAGIKVAKHGNRSISSQSGSADVLEQLNVPLTLSQPLIEKALQENGIAFLFAQHVHPTLKQMMQVRKSLGIPTVFNLIGPLTNPVHLTTQLIGVYRRDLLVQMANVLHQLGRKRAVVLNGAGYLDEASLAGENHCVLLERGEYIPFTIRPEEVGLKSVSNTAVKGGDPRENAAILQAVLTGEKGPHRDVVLLNAGLGIFANGKASTVQEGVERAKESIDSGSAQAKLNYLIKMSDG